MYHKIANHSWNQNGPQKRWCDDPNGTIGQSYFHPTIDCTQKVDEWWSLIVGQLHHMQQALCEWIHGGMVNSWCHNSHFYIMHCD